MLASKVVNHIREKAWQREHARRCLEYRARFHNPGVSILSMNCTGGILYHDLGLQFRSPTVNLFMRAEAFVKFCENLDYYLSIDELVECTDMDIIEDRTYPIAWLGDILLFLVHYHSVGEAQEKWNERKKRIDKNNLVILNTDREGMTGRLKDRFEKLPYRKVMFCHKPDEARPSCVYLRGYENENSVGIITDHIGWKGLRPVDQFDWVNFLNGDCNA